MIEVESLSKKFILNHKKGVNHNFRESLALKVKTFFINPLNLFEKKGSQEEFWALKEVSFKIEVGDRVAILGRNGSGKSTLLKILSRITEPTKGKVSIKGKVASLLEVGTGFHPELTGRENIFLNGVLLGMNKKEIVRKFDEIVAFSEIEQFLDTPVKRYSSGMYVRLAFAVAAHLESDILFVDEVLAVGDTRFQKKCIGKLEEAKLSGRTILFVTHNMSALQFCNKGLYLDKGHLIKTNTLQECIQLYHDSCIKDSMHTWEGETGDEHIRIKKLKLISQEGLEVFSKYSSLKIEGVFEVLQPLKDFSLGLLFYNAQGTHLLTQRFTLDDHVLLTLKRGKYQIATTIDLSLFAEGIYRVEVDAGFYNSSRFKSTDVHLNFEVVNPKKIFGEPTNILSTNWPSELNKLS